MVQDTTYERKIIKLALNNLEGYICQQSLNKSQKASVIRPRKELILLHQNKSFRFFFSPMRNTQNKSNRQIKDEEKIFQHIKHIKNMNRGYKQTPNKEDIQQVS